MIYKKNIYKLVHIYDNEDEEIIKELGFYSTVKNAKKAIGRYKVLEGFNIYPVECFHIEKYELDKDAEWTEGFTNTEEIFRDFDRFSKCFEIWLRRLEEENIFIKEAEQYEMDYKYHIDEVKLDKTEQHYYNVLCEIYEKTVFEKNIDDIVECIKGIFKKRFIATEISTEQYTNLASLLKTSTCQGDGLR